MIARLDEQDSHDCQAERKSQLERDPLARRVLDRHAPAQSLDARSDDVHSNATAGGLIDLERGRETRLEDQLERLVVA